VRDPKNWWFDCTEVIVEDWYDLVGKVRKAPSNSLDFFTDLLDPNNEEEPFFDFDNEKAWGGRHVSIEGYTGNEGGSVDITYHK